MVQIGYVTMQQAGTGMFANPTDARTSMAVYFPPSYLSAEGQAQADDIARQLNLPPAPGQPGGTILLNDRFFGPNGSSIQPPTVNWLPFGTGTAEGVMTHEFGHGVDWTLSRTVAYSSDELHPWTAWRGDMLADYHGAAVGDSPPSGGRTDLHGFCGYAAMNFKEAIACVFQAAYTPDAGTNRLLNGRSMFGPSQVAIINGMKAAIDGVKAAAASWKIVKYSDDQPREPAGTPEGGEFAGGSGSMTAAEATLRLDRMWPGIDVNLAAVDRELIGPAVREFAALHAAYPGVRLDQLQNYPIGRPAVLAQTNTRTPWIQLNSYTWRSKDTFDFVTGSDAEWTVSRPGRFVEDTIAHEFGHLIAKQFFGTAFADAGAPETSDYSKTNSAEKFAEAFTQAWIDPVRSEAGRWWASAIEHRDTLTGKADVVKYSDEEARDDRGRWTDGGGMIGADEAIKRLGRAFPGINDGKTGGLEHVNRVLLSQITRQLEHLHQQYPGVHVSRLVGVRSGLGSGRSAVATATRGPFMAPGQIALNLKYWAGGLIFDRATAGDVVYRSSAPAAADTITHEFAHLIDFQYFGGHGGDGPTVSRYSFTNELERFAEAFTAAQADPSSAAGQWWAEKWASRVVKVDKAASPLTFATQARKILQQGYADAYAAGWGGSGLDGEWYDGEWDPDELDAAVDPQTNLMGDFLTGLAALLMGGATSDAMIDARLGQYAATLNAMYEQGFGDGVGDQGTVTQSTWHTEEDGIVCPLCDGRDAQVWLGDEEHPYPGDGTYGEQCILAGQDVASPAIQKVYRRTYDGPAIRLMTAESGSLSVTQNHPVLTLHGWVPAKLLKPGDDVVCGTLRQEVGLPGAHVQDVPAPFEEVRRAAAVSGVTSRILGRRVDFHGDGVTDREVDVVATDRLLLDDVDAAGGEPSCEHVLAGPDVCTCGLAMARGLRQRLFGVMGTAPGVMAGGADRAAFRRGPTAVDEETAVVRVANDSGEVQATGDRRSIEAGRGGEIVGRLSVAVAPDQLVDRDGTDLRSGDRPRAAQSVGILQPAQAYSEAFQAHANDVAADVVVRRELQDGLAAFVTMTKIVRVDHGWYSGHVYNLKTDTGWYLAGDNTASASRILVSNCMGGPNCRCELWYDVVPIGDAAAQVEDQTYDPTAESDLAAVSTASLLKVRSLLKYSEDQPRGVDGRWTSGGSIDTGSPAWKAIGDRIDRQGLGNCYPAAVTLMLHAKELGLRDPKVIQATAVGQGAIRGQSFGHAWIESSLKVGPTTVRIATDYSSGKRLMLPADYYRQLGRVTDVHEFDHEQTLLQMVKSGHYGPWESDPPNTGPGIPTAMSELWDKGQPIFIDAGTASWPVAVDDLAAAHAARRVGRMTTADLVALKRFLAKYSPDQPRDEDGRFASGAGSEAELMGAPKLDGELAHIAGKWIGGHAAYYRDALSGNTATVLGGAARAIYGSGAKMLVEAVNAARPTTYPLYRGIGVSKADYASFGAAFRPGATVDMNLSSWTKEDGRAREFASNSMGTQDGDGMVAHQVIFALDPGAQALDISGVNPELSAWTEHLSAGRYEVTDTKHEEITVASWVPPITIDTITLRQVATLSPADLVGTKLEKYDDAEPRDDHGRWAAEGRSFDEAIASGEPDAHPALASWANGDGYSAIRAAAAGDPGASPRAKEYAQQIATMVADSHDDSPMVYRGLTVDDATAARFAAMKSGDTMDLNLSSWSENSWFAAGWAGSGAAGPGGTGVVLQALTVNGVNIGGDYDEAEWITDGRFVVEFVDHSVEGTLTVGVTQESKFSPLDLVGTKGAS